MITNVNNPQQYTKYRNDQNQIGTEFVDKYHNWRDARVVFEPWVFFFH